jgi:hypothetical protein
MPLTSSAPSGTPQPSSEVDLAQRAGPGFLDYCPLHNGTAKAKIDISIPGSPQVPGWCRTAVNPSVDGTTVAFTVHWDARGTAAKSGTMRLTYYVPVPPSPQTTPQAVLVAQRGMPPP